MASSSQHRCVFVGNIPYDATEEQLIQICEEVGPVVSFRLVIDRETGKPKGYGFCEYKDEETALSARRNLQGYEINGRQLRVDFAENDKNSDRNREQGRGGPGMVASLDPQKQFGGLAVVGDSGMQQPIGLSIALTASSIMAQALGGAQTGSRSNLGQPALVADPLTLHLAKMSRNQLNEIMSEMKVLATQNRERACQVLLMNPVLTKALFQAQIALKMITPQMLQKPNIRQAPGSLVQPLLQDNQQGQQPTVESLPGLAPITSMMQFSHQVQGQIPSGLLNPMVSNQHAAISQLPTQPQIRLPQLAQNPGLQQGLLPGQSGVANLPLIRPPPSGSLPVRPQNQVATSYVVKQPVHPHLSQHPGQMGAVNLGPNPPLVAASTFQPSILARPPLLDQNFQLSSSASSSIPDGRRVDIYPSFPSGLPEKASKAYDGSDLQTRPSKLARLDGGKSSLSVAGLDVSTTVSVPAQALDTSGGQMSKPEVPSDSVKHFPQLQLPPEVESALLQQVLNLTPEQLSSLPPDQQQQVIQLQQMLRPPS